MSSRGRGQPHGRGGSSDTTAGRSGGGARGFEGRGVGGGRGRGRGSEGRGRPGGGRGGPRGENVPVQVPTRLSPANLQKLVDGFKSLTVKPEQPLRPGYGTAGTPITLRANFFAVKVPQGPVYDYVVEVIPTITPKTDIDRIKGRLFDLLELSPLCKPHVPYIAHDRSQRVVSARKLPQPLDIQVPFYDEHEKSPGPNAKVYTISIRFERELDPRQLTRYMDGNPGSRDYVTLPLISALNLVLQQYANRAGVRVGKSRYFFPTSSKYSLGPGLEAIQGFYASIRPAYKQLMVNVNVCMTAFIVPGNLADRLMEFNRNSRDAMPTLPRTRKKLIAIGTTSARNTYFNCEEFGGKISVERYFFKKYKRKLNHATDLPVVDLGTTKRQWVPAELCEIEPGNAFREKLSDRETAQMIRYARHPPKSTPRILSTVDTNMSDIPGRELAPPRLTYKVGQAKVQNGSWNIRDVQFHRGARIGSWWVLVVKDGRGIIQGPQDGNLQGLVQSFSAKLRKTALPDPSSDPDRTLGLNIIREILKTALTQSKVGKPSFVLVLLENRDHYIYPGIKRIGDVELGIHTIHMQLEKALGDERNEDHERKQDQYFSNVALKVNTKLGGMNHLLENRAMGWLTKKKTMMVGIDVTHPGRGSKHGTPSIAAVVASVDDDFVQFPASLRIQKSKKEMLDELRDMMVERLLVYEKKNEVLPARIIVYRDGVSEGQFDIVLKEELPQILDAFEKLSTKDRKNYKPQLSIIICGKRHHARFYATNSQYADRNGNTRPGTVVDKGVTGVFDFDFYLQAHAGIQGSVKSTHYTVVYDENNLQADEIQQGTHDTSHLYGRATKAVSLIPAAYYADLACERGRCYLNEFLVDDKSSTAGGRGRLSKEEEAKQVFEAAKKAWGEGLHPELRDSMFYI
ncbi:argonaute-like protein [Flammula alnicola]|nr:argonaute-like protein [Flammula alnicola]